MTEAGVTRLEHDCDVGRRSSAVSKMVTTKKTVMAPVKRSAALLSAGMG
jgi:hypothetical protein